MYKAQSFVGLSIFTATTHKQVAKRKYQIPIALMFKQATVFITHTRFNVEIRSLTE